MVSLAIAPRMEYVCSVFVGEMVCVKVKIVGTDYKSDTSTGSKESFKPIEKIIYKSIYTHLSNITVISDTINEDGSDAKSTLFLAGTNNVKDFKLTDEQFKDWIDQLVERGCK